MGFRRRRGLGRLGGSGSRGVASLVICQDRADDVLDLDLGQSHHERLPHLGIFVIAPDDVGALGAYVVLDLAHADHVGHAEDFPPPGHRRPGITERVLGIDFRADDVRGIDLDFRPRCSAVQHGIGLDVQVQHGLDRGLESGQGTCLVGCSVERLELRVCRQHKGHVIDDSPACDDGLGGVGVWHGHTCNKNK